MTTTTFRFAPSVQQQAYGTRRAPQEVWSGFTALVAASTFAIAYLATSLIVRLAEVA